MEWADIKITVPRAEAELCEAIATDLVGSGVYIEDYGDLEIEAPRIAPVDFIDEALLQKDRETVAVHLYLPEENHPETVLSLLKERLSAAGISYHLDRSTQQQEDWETSWKAYYHPIEIGGRLMLCPAWEAVETSRTVLRLDPGMAFGTGTHETTALCLELVDRLVKGGEAVLDIGCGSGILGIAACLLGAESALGIDIDPMAVRIAEENAALNQAEHAFHAVEGDLSQKAEGPYDLILANIVANAILALAPSIPPLLGTNGRFIASGIIEERCGEVTAALEAAGLVPLEVLRKNGWVCILAKAA